MTGVLLQSEKSLMRMLVNPIEGLTWLWVDHSWRETIFKQMTNMKNLRKREKVRKKPKKEKERKGISSPTQSISREYI